MTSPSDARLRAMRCQMDAALDVGTDDGDWEWYDELIVSVRRLADRDRDRLALMELEEA